MGNRNKNINPSFSKILKKLREERELTQAQVGNIVNKGESTVRMWELRSSEPDYETILILADYFNVSVDYLLGRDPITPAERAAGWIDTKKANLTPQEDDWLAKRDEILRLYGDEGLKAVTAMIDTYINAKTANFQQKTDKNGTKY